MARWRVAFAPNIDNNQLIELIVEIEAYKRSVLKLPLPPDFARALDRLNIVRQIKGTTGIEGNALSNQRIEELVFAEADGAAASAANVEEQEVINAQQVLLYIRQLVKSQPAAPITEGLIREFHERMTIDCGHADNSPGRYRRHNVTVGAYHPPDYEELPDLMRQFVEYINSREVAHFSPLVRAVLAHFYLISIHPFGDGNGRTSRALEAYILCQSGYNVRGFYSLANYFYSHRDDYFAHLQDARFKHGGNLTEFARFALQGYREELEGIQTSIIDFVSLRLFRDMYFDAFRRGAINARGLTLAEYLTFDATSGVSVVEFKSRVHHLAAALYRGKSPRTLQRDLDQLQRAGLVVIQDEKLLANLAIMNQF